MRIFFCWLLTGLLWYGRVAAQTHFTDSVDRAIEKMMKRKIVLTDLINDSTGQTYYLEKKTKQPFYACLKLNRDSVTVETHYCFLHETILRISITTWHWKMKQVETSSFYFNNRKLVFDRFHEIPEKYSAQDLLKNADAILNDAKKFSAKSGY